MENITELNTPENVEKTLGAAKIALIVVGALVTLNVARGVVHKVRSRRTPTE